MCRITRLRCQVCQPHWTKAELAGTSASSTSSAAATIRTYRFRPCAQIKRRASSPGITEPLSLLAVGNGQRGEVHNDNDNDNDHNHDHATSGNTAEHTLPPGTRLHCPNLIWPLPSRSPLAEIEDFICDACLHAGTTHYHWTVREKQLEALRVNTYGQRAVPPHDDAPPPLVNDEASSTQQQQPLHDPSSFVLPAASQVQGSFPPEWDTLVSNEMRTQVFTEHIERAHAESTSSNTFMIDALPEPDWTPRLSEAPHRHLTLWIPCCKLCREPALRHAKVDRVSHDKFAGLEFEPSSVLWKWLGRLPERPGVTTTISTGFLYKPCASCVERETALRARVGHFLADSPNNYAWAVWHWLLARGSGQADFWQHELANIGLPSGRAWDIRFFMHMMGEGWWYRTGVAWDDLGHLKPATEKLTLAMSHHKGMTLVSLTQWEDLVRRLEPADKFPPAPPPGELESLPAKDMTRPDEALQQAPQVEEPPPEPERVVRRSIPTALKALQIRTTDPHDLPRRYRSTLHNAAKTVKRFVTFRGLCIDPDTGRAAKMVDYLERKKHGQSDLGAVEESLPKRRRLEGDGRPEVEGRGVSLLPPAEVTSMAGGYPSPQASVPARDSGDSGADGLHLVECKPGCGYSHMPRGAANARDMWSVELGLRRA